MEYLNQYQSLVMAVGAVGGLMFVQLLTADIAGMRSNHKPGATPEPDHGKFHFRSVRTIGNMNESVAIFIIFAIAGVLSGADPVWMSWMAWLYLGARVLFTLCYWLNIKALRSVFFGVSLLGLLGMGLTMIRAFIG